MALIVRGYFMYFEWCGSTAKDAPVVVLSSGLGGSAHFWQSQLPALQQDFRVLIYDQLGTGRSPAVLPNDYTIEHMANELLTLLDSQYIQQCHFVGHALGGLVGLQLALQRADLLKSLVLINAWSSPNPHTLRCFNIRKSLLNNDERQSYLQMQALLLYPPDWIMGNVKMLEEEEQHLLTHFPDVNNLLSRIKALSQFDVDALLHKIEVETLLVANRDDLLVPWQRSNILLDGLPNAELHVFDYGGHACTITEPDTFNQLLIKHLANVSHDSTDIIKEK